MNQETNITEAMAIELLRAIRTHKQPATIDWTNRTIRILGEPVTDPDVILSTGPMVYQDILYAMRVE